MAHGSRDSACWPNQARYGGASAAALNRLPFEEALRPWNSVGFLARGTPRGPKCGSSISGILLRDAGRTQNAGRVDTLSCRPVLCPFCIRSSGGGEVPGSAENTARCSGIGSRSVVQHVRHGRPLLQSLHWDRPEDPTFLLTGNGRSLVPFFGRYSAVVLMPGPPRTIRRRERIF